MEAIIDQRLVKGKKEFLVKWKGYFDDECTWEPPEHLVNAEDKMLEFTVSHPEPQQSKKKPTTPRKAGTKSRSNTFFNTPDPLVYLYHSTTINNPEKSCLHCKTDFASRNALFRHLRSGCDALGY